MNDDISMNFNQTLVELNATGITTAIIKKPEEVGILLKIGLKKMVGKK